MKKIFLSITFVIVVTSLFAQGSEEKELKLLMKDLGYSWIETNQATLREGENAYYWRTFYAGNEYSIIAFSEKKGVYDIDVYLYNLEGNLKGQSESNGDFEIIEYFPTVSKQMKIVMKNFECSEELIEYKCKFMVFYK